LAFNAENVWANVQKLSRKQSEAGVIYLDFDFDNTSRWKPLFAKGKEELLRLTPEITAHGTSRKLASGRLSLNTSGRSLNPSTSSAGALSVGMGVEPQSSYLLEDPAQALTYEPVDTAHAQRVERALEERLEQDIMDYRSRGEHTGERVATRFDSAISRRLSPLLDMLEQLENCRRRGGEEADFPLRSQSPAPAKLEDVEKKLREVEDGFRGPSQRNRVVYGLPINQPYLLGDDKQLWNAIRDSRILELGDSQAEYALKVRVYPYASHVLSVWVFIACAMDNN